MGLRFQPHMSLNILGRAVTSLEGAWASILVGAGGGTGAAEGAVLLARAGRLLGAGRLVRERAAAQQGGFLRDEGGGGGVHKQNSKLVVACKLYSPPSEWCKLERSCSYRRGTCTSQRRGRRTGGSGLQRTDHRSVTQCCERIAFSPLPVSPLLAGSVQDVSDSRIPDFATA